MNSGKKDLLNVRISPQVKAALQKAADIKKVSITDMLTEIITEYCRRHRVPLNVPEQHRSSDDRYVFKLHLHRADSTLK